MVDKERIEKRLLDIERYSTMLSKIVPNNYEKYIKSESITKAAVERYLQLISDLELEVLLHVYKDIDLGISGSEESLVSRFENLLSKEVVGGFKKRRTLRNILVYAYFDMHYDKEVFEQAKNRNDISDFIKEIKEIVKKHS